MYDLSKLYLQLDADQALEQALQALVSHYSLPAVLLNVSSEYRGSQDDVARLVQTVQALDAAALIQDNPELAHSVGADGVHLSFGSDLTERYDIARRTLRDDCIVGADVALSRHDAMTIGETGADYVGFNGAVNHLDLDDDGDVQHDLVSWWAEVFEIPCVALNVARPERARQMTDAGVDFVGLVGDVSSGAESLQEQIISVAQAIAPSPDEAAVHG